MIPKQLHWRILLGIVLGAILGFVFNQTQSDFVVSYIMPVLNLFAGIFLKLLKMIVVPLVATSVFLGVTSVGNSKALAKIGSRTGLYYLCTSLIAILTGLFFVNAMQPGIGAEVSLGEAAKTNLKTSATTVGDLILRVIPKNPFQALAEYDMLGIIFFMILFGIFILKLQHNKKENIKELFEVVYEASILIVEFIIRLAPIGVFCLVVKLVQSTGLEVFIPLLKYVATAALTLGFHMLVNLPALYWFKTKKNPYKYFGIMTPALLTGFSSASSAATLPLTMECSEKAGVRKKTTSLVLPLGATVNMDGTALYEGVAVLFIAQALGVDLSILQQFTVLLTALMVSIGAAGIPHAGLVMMVIILEAVGLPVEATGMIWAVDRVVDMMRTSVNIWSDSVCAAVVDDSVSDA